MSRRISSFTAGLGALLIAGGVSAAPASGPVEKGLGIASSERNAKPKPKGKKGADADADADEAEAEDEKPKKKGKKAKKEEPPEEEVEEKPKKKGKKAKKEEPPEEEVEEKPKKKGKKGKKEEPPEEEPMDLKESEAPDATAEEDPDELEEEPPAEPAPSEEAEEDENAEAAASVSTADAAGKLYLGLRLGFGLAMGKATGDDPPLVDFSNKIPIWLDLGYRFSPSFLLALYGQYAFATLNCPEGRFCSGATVMRFGLQAQYGFAPDAQIAPWVGLGFGYEMANATLTQGGVETKVSLKGVEFLNLQLGADYMVSKSAGIGPFLSFSLGRYASGDVEEAGTTATGGVSKKEFHEWLVLGVRGAFSL